MIDLLLIAGIVGGALYLLYRSLWKKGCYCPGCEVQGCNLRNAPAPPTQDYQEE